jgi:hypothetical protein
MSVLKEFACKAHGPFEEMVEQDQIPSCPNGCSPRFVVREIRSPPAARGIVTGKLDGLQREIAKDFNLPDIKVGKDDGKSVMQNLQSGQDFRPRWVDVPNKSSSAKDLAASMGMMGGNALQGTQFQKPTPIIMGSHKASLPSVD